MISEEEAIGPGQILPSMSLGRASSYSIIWRSWIDNPLFQRNYSTTDGQKADRPCRVAEETIIKSTSRSSSAFLPKRRSVRYTTAFPLNKQMLIASCKVESGSFTVMNSLLSNLKKRRREIRGYIVSLFPKRLSAGMCQSRLVGYPRQRHCNLVSSS